MYSFAIICLFVYECYESNLGYGSDEDIENKHTSNDDEYLPEIGFVNKIDDEGEELVFEMEYVNIWKGDLIEDDESEIDGWEKGRDEVEFFDEGFVCDEFPCREDNLLFEKQVFLMFSWCVFHKFKMKDSLDCSTWSRR